MSLAIGQLTGAVLGAVLFVVFEPSGVRFGFDRAKAAELLRFGLPLAGSSVIVFAVGNIDRLVVGALLGPVSLGIYILAVNLSNWPGTLFSQPVRAVAPAMMARLQGSPQAMRQTFLTTAQLLTSAALPVCAVLAAASTPLVGLMYGSAWSGAAAVLPWLAALAALRALFDLCYDFLVVLGRTRVVLTAQVVWLVVLVPFAVLGAHLYGPAGAAGGQVVAALLVALPIYAYELQRADVPVRTLLGRLAVPLAAASLVVVLAWSGTRLIGNDLGALVVSGALGAAVVAILGYRMRDTLRRLRDVDPGRSLETGEPVEGVVTTAPA
jgi:PST family polysaccharide transporter